MKSAAANDLAIVNAFGDPELLYILVQSDCGLGEQPPGTDVVTHQPADRPHVPGPRTSDRILHRPHTLARGGNRPSRRRLPALPRLAASPATIGHQPRHDRTPAPP